MTQMLIAGGLLALLAQAVMMMSANLGAIRTSLQERSARFSTELNIKNTLGVFEFCKVALQGQTLNVNDRTTHQPVLIFAPNAVGNRGALVATSNMIVGPLIITELSLQVLSSAGNSHLTRFVMQLTPRSRSSVVWRPMQMEIVIEGAPDASGRVVIQSCRAHEEWTQLSNMKTCPANQIVSGFNPDGSLICQTGPPGPPGPPGGAGISSCDTAPPSGGTSICVSTGTGGSTWAPY